MRFLSLSDLGCWAGAKRQESREEVGDGTLRRRQTRGQGEGRVSGGSLGTGGGRGSSSPQGLPSSCTPG